MRDEKKDDETKCVCCGFAPEMIPCPRCGHPSHSSREDWDE